MMKEKSMESPTLEAIKSRGLLAVIRGPSLELTLQMVEALLEGGVTGIEITYTTPDAAEVVRSLKAKHGQGILLGMGTLTHPEQAEEARQAGAQFLVSPHVDPQLAEAMRATRLPMMMGAMTPSEVVRSYTLGSDVVKLFPGSLVGPDYMRALKGPFPNIPMMPTGGVGIDNIEQWFQAGAFAVGAGSELCPPNLAREGRFDEIILRAREFRRAVEAARNT
jgi:2-dehydro-3-deoxyphosphogluconate aldolase / (4S)-4-hydroxy-2-oxoglutarate aldolase